MVVVFVCEKWKKRRRARDARVFPSRFDGALPRVSKGGRYAPCPESSSYAVRIQES